MREASGNYQNQMPQIIVIFALLAIAALGAWGLIRRNQAKKLAEQEAREENERLTAERLAHERAAAEAKALNDARFQAEAEERNRKEAEAKENARLAEEEERRVAEEKLALEMEARRRAEEKALADAQDREAARLEAEAEARQRAEAEAREQARVTAEEERRAEECRQAEAQAKAAAEAREETREAAGQEARSQAEATVEREQAPSEPYVEAPPPEQPPQSEEVPCPPTYQPTAPSPTTASPRQPRSPRPPRAQAENANTILHLRVQLVFGRGGVVRNLALAPDRRDGMPDKVEITGTQGDLHLAELREDCYEPVTLPDAGNALLQGIEWRGRGDARRWRWVLGGRELYVLAPGDEFGLHGFVSTARLWLNARHVVLATNRLRDEVLAALTQAGCATPDVSDDSASGVPAGWLLFRDVIPTRAVPMRDDRDLLNALCPAHEIEPHFAGGIRLQRNTWLAGYPPRIRFTGEFVNGFEVKIDGHVAQRASDGAFEAPGWDSEGEHRLWFGDQAETYSLCTMEESWSHWHAHDFGTGAAICGASTCQADVTRQRQVRVPASNPLLIGARPGEIFCCHSRSDVRCESLLAMVSFVPVWALPLDPAHVDKQSARILLLNSTEPQNDVRVPTVNRTVNRKLAAWSAAIREASCKGLRLALDDEQARALWRKYRIVAKQLRRKLR
jgi:hypothetical protein